VFTHFLRESLAGDTKVLLICCVSPQATAQTQIALDYCQKLKCYFSGTAEGDVERSRSEIGSMISGVSRLKQSVEKIKKKGSSTDKVGALQDKLEKLAMRVSGIQQDSFGVDSNSTNKVKQQLERDLSSIQATLLNFKDQFLHNGSGQRSNSLSHRASQPKKSKKQ